MKLWLLNYEWIHDFLLLMLFWNMLLMRWYNGYPYLWIGDENCGCCWKIVKVWWFVEFWWKWCFNLKFYASLSVYSCIWPVNIFEISFGHLKDQNLEFWAKRVWNPNFFDKTDERSLKRAISELQASVPSSFWTQFAWASCKRALRERD